MSPFIDRFPEVAGREMLILHIKEKKLPLPPGEYAFMELFCSDDSFDCRRALLQVISPQFPGRVLATINYGWESEAFYTEWMHGDAEAEREINEATLDPLNPQSPLADALLDGFRDYVRADSFLSPATETPLRNVQTIMRRAAVNREIQGSMCANVVASRRSPLPEAFVGN